MLNGAIEGWKTHCEQLESVVTELKDAYAMQKSAFELARESAEEFKALLALAVEGLERIADHNIINESPLCVAIGYAEMRGIAREVLGRVKG